MMQAAGIKRRWSSRGMEWFSICQVIGLSPVSLPKTLNPLPLLNYSCQPYS